MKQDQSSESQQHRRDDLFLKLLLSNETRIYAYILKLIPNYADADEIMQETSGILWRKFHQFTPGTDFVAWAIRIAHYEILDFRRKKGKDTTIYNENLVREVAQYAIDQSIDNEESRIEALRGCLSKLNTRHQTLIQMRYFENKSPKEIAQHLNFSIHNIYKSISRIQGQLLDCVKRTLASQDIVY